MLWETPSHLESIWYKESIKGKIWISVLWNVKNGLWWLRLLLWFFILNLSDFISPRISEFLESGHIKSVPRLCRWCSSHLRILLAPWICSDVRRILRRASFDLKWAVAMEWSRPLCNEKDRCWHSAASPALNLLCSWPWTYYIAQACLELWISLPGTGSSIMCYHIQLNGNLCPLPNLTDVVEEPFRSR